MKRSTVPFLLAGLMTIATQTQAKTRLAVSTLADKTGSSRCNIGHHWGNNLGDGFKDQLMTALSEKGRFSLQERENLKTMHNEEHELINADEGAKPKANQFKAAHFSITGAVTQFEMCNEELGGKLNVGKLLGFDNSKLKVGGKTAKAKVALDLRVVNVETGEVLTSFKVEGSSSSMKFDMDGDLKGADFSTDAFSASPIGQATEEAIQKAADKIAAKLPDRKESKQVAVVAPKSSAKRKLASPIAKNAVAHESVVAQKTGLVTSAKTSVNTVCPVDWHNEHFRTQCKILNWSESGQRAEVIMLEKGKKKFFTKDQIMELQPSTTMPALGSEVWLNGKQASRSEREYQNCIVSDVLDGDVVINCRGEELQASLDAVFVSKQVRKVAGQ